LRCGCGRCWRAHGDEATYRQFVNRYRKMATDIGFDGHIAMANAMR
jgi:adenylate cyclase